MADFSFIPLYKTIGDALIGLDLPAVSELDLAIRPNAILDPYETTRQITNVSGGVALLPIVTVELVDLCGHFVKDITEFVAIQQFQHDYDGAPQLAFEIAPLGIESGGRLRMLKFTGQAEVFYSTPIICSGQFRRQSVVLDYWNSTTFKNISYRNSNAVRQRVRVMGLTVSGNATSGELAVYNQFTTDRLQAVEVSGRAQLVPQKLMSLWLVSEFSYNRLCEFFIHNNKYVDGKRLTSSVIVPGGTYEGQTGAISGEFTVAVDRWADSYNGNALALVAPLTLTTRYPSGIYTPTSFIETISGTYNYPITINTGGLISVFDADTDTLLGSFTPVVAGNGFTVDISGLAMGVGSYTWTISAGAFGYMFGVSGAENTAFQIAEGNYDITNDYDTNDYF